MRPAGLTIFTHNVAGLVSLAAVVQLVTAWHAAQAAVVCLQETWAEMGVDHARPTTVAQLNAWLLTATEAIGAPPYQAYWAPNSTVPDQRNGVAILVCSTSGVQVTNHQPSACGRLQTVHMQWAGHHLCLANSYWPSAGLQQRLAFLEDTLAPATVGLDNLILCGDFNFTPDPTCDRLPACPSTARHDGAAQAAFVAQWPTLADAYRWQHPGRRGLTFFRPAGAARLDRIYVPATLLPHLGLSPPILRTPKGDHNAPGVTLQPNHPPSGRGPGRRTVPSCVFTSPEAVADLTEWSQRMVAYGLTLSDPDLVTWWPFLQHACVAAARAWHRHLCAEREGTAAAVAGLQAAVAAAEQAVESAAPAALQHALRQATTAQQALHTGSHASAVPVAAQAQAAWLHHNEQPTPLLTRLMHPRSPATTIAGISVARRLVTDSAGIAATLASHFAAVSAQPVVDAAAQDAVLHALQQQLHAGTVHSIPADLAAAAGEAAVTEAEVRVALAHTPAVSSPGPDGVPYAVWRLGDCCWAPLLARLFTAIGTTGITPTGFNCGTITPLPKPAAPDPRAAAAFRPITLLPTVYRVLAMVLAARFGAAMAPAVGPEQSAFLPGRAIEDAITTITLLPQALAAEGRCGAHVFLDTAKAFDTVDRPFLFRLMAAMGASPGMIHWARVLLAGTWASVHANGVESPRLPWHAGVRQGCPLSPLLYLFVAQGITSLLASQPALGVTVDGQRHVATLYADDNTAHIGDSDIGAALPVLRATLATAAAATGNAPNWQKCAVLPIGVLPPGPAPVEVAGFPVQASVVSLGILQSNPPAPPAAALRAPYSTRGARRPPAPAADPVAPARAAAWRPRLAQAVAGLTRVGHLPLSAMGRGMAASAYALSTFLFHAEFAGLPSAGITRFLAQAQACVGRGLPHDALVCRPQHGGFGMLPLLAHVQARHAAMASRLLGHLCSPQPPPARPPPWVSLASALLRATCPSLHPAQTLLLATLAPAHAVARGDLCAPAPHHQPLPLPPGPLTRMAVALHALGPLHAPPQHPPAAATIGAVGLLLPAALLHLHWPPHAAHPHGAPVHPAHGHASVRALTTLLAGDAHGSLAVRHQQFVQLATSANVPSAPAPAATASFHRAMACAWRVRCGNQLKEAMWRLAAGAVPGSRVQPWVCPCGGAHEDDAPRMHTFWLCPVAVAVRQQLCAALPPAAVILCHHLWLLSTPHAACAQPVWILVCLCAVDAMEYGRQRLWAQWRSPAWPLDVPARLAAVAATANAATQRFWHNVQGATFAAPVLPASWAAVGPAHPFVCVVDGCARVHVPAARAAGGGPA